MTRKDYIDGLEKNRKQIKEIGAAFAAVDLTDATDMESDRRKKTAKLVADLGDRLYEDIAISAKVAADKANAGTGEQGDLFDAAKAKAAKEAKKPGAAAAAADAEVVDVPAIEHKPLALPAPKPEKKHGKKNGGKKKGGAK